MTFDAELARTCERMRMLSEPRLRARADDVQRLLQGMADEGLNSIGHPGCEVPRLEPRAWADQLQVLGSQALETVPADRLTELTERLVAVRRGFDLAW